MGGGGGVRCVAKGIGCQSLVRRNRSFHLDAPIMPWCGRGGLHVLPDGKQWGFCTCQPATGAEMARSQHTHTPTHTYSSQRHDPFLCLTTDASWRMKKCMTIKKRRDNSESNETRVCVCVCEGQMLAWSQGTA